MRIRISKSYCHSCEKWLHTSNFMLLSTHGGKDIYRAVCNKCIASGKTMDNLFNRMGERVATSALTRRGYSTDWFIRN